MAQQGVQQPKNGTQPDRLKSQESRRSFSEQTQVLAPPSQLAQRMIQSPQQLGRGDVAYLQRAIGNQAVAHLLRSTAADSAAPPIQAKLTVGPAHDRYEEEADRVAKSISGAPVQRAAVPSTRSTPLPKSKVQRASDPQALAPIGPQGGSLDAETGQTIRRAQGGGRPIDAQVRAPLEQKLGTDLSHARLHVNRQADDLNQRVGARAFTTGADIFVQRSEYQPQSKDGRALLYHELTHVHQQTGHQQTGHQQTGHQQTGHQAKSIQRVISKDEGTFDTSWETLYGNKHQEKKQQSVDYLSGLSTKQTDKKKRKEQAGEIKEMKGLLHFSKKETTTTTPERRQFFRAILTAERARGQSIRTLMMFKAYMLQYADKFTDIQYKFLLQGQPDNVKGFIGYAKGEYKAPTEVIDLFHSHNPGTVDNSINSLETEINQIVPKANQLAKTSDKPAIIRLRSMTPKVGTTLQAAKDARAGGHFEMALYYLKQASELLEVIWQLYTYGQVSAKSNLSTEKESGDAKRLGGGQVSKVYEVKYKPELNPSIKHGAFKQETRTYESGSQMGASGSGISTVEANFGGRSVASYKVDKLLGGGMTPKTKFGTHQGMGGTVQDWAKGSAPQTTVEMGGMGDVDTRYREFDYSDPELQRQLATLQLLDAITGQVDRHPGNYYIYQGPGGTQVTAIDNDLSFGKDKDVERLIDPGWKRPIPEDQSRGVPLFVDEGIAQQILDTTPKQLKETIVGMLTEAEVAKTLVRFSKVKAELRKKKANTARIKTLQAKVDVMSKYAGKFGSKHSDVEDGLNTQISFYKNEIAKRFSQGALIDRSEWGSKTAQHLTNENSYFGVLVEMHDYHKKQGKTIGVDD